MKNKLELLALFVFTSTVFGQTSHGTMYPAVRGSHQMVGAGNSLEVAAGTRLLEQGGYAIDAGVAAALGAAITLRMDHFLVWAARCRCW